VKIREIRAFGLFGQTPEGGWSNELQPEDCVHTILAVLTDQGAVGWGSVFTSADLVRASLAVLRPLYRARTRSSRNALAKRCISTPSGRAAAAPSPTPSAASTSHCGILLGKASDQPVGRLLGGRYRERVEPYASLLMREPEAMAEQLLPVKAQGFRAFKIGWGPFGKRNASVDEAIVRAARDAVGPESLLMVDAGASDAFWPRDYKWALHTAHMLEAYGVAWFEEPLTPDSFERLRSAPPRGAYPDRRRRVPHAAAGFQPWLQSGAFDIVQPDVTKCGG
jgi:L-alanine-DL-glutamate epimerase-like enolase superfamily enzyme